MSAVPVVPLGTSDGAIFTNSGRWVSLLHPDPESIAIGDIGHALAHLTRFGGHTQRFYSVAQHALQVSYRQRRDKSL